MTSSDKEQIRKVFEEVYAANVKSRNLQGYGEMYSENALWIPPDQADRRGILDIVEGFAQQIANQDIDPTFTAEEIEVLGDFGYVIGTSIATVHPKNKSEQEVKDGKNEPNKVTFRALWLMKKEQGVWKIDRQIWNKKPSKAKTDL